MNKKNNPSATSRRSFIKKAVGTALVTGAAPFVSLGQTSTRTIEMKEDPVPDKRYGANDKVNVAIIGMGIMGNNNAETTSKIPGVKIVAACDLYTGRLDHAKELYGKDLFTTKNYQEILDRKDIDAVIIATSDHWHDHISIDALKKGKHVYCEKPMVHHLDEGAAVIDAHKKSGKVMQVGSQRVSSIATLKAKEIFEQGVIGKLVLVEAINDRHSPNGAWQYSIPTDAKNGTVDWDRYQGDAPKTAYDPLRFFRWRNYQDYGTGIAGDLFVHLFSGLHTVISSKGPNRIYGTGGLRYFRDGRDVPDLITSIHDYPETKEHSAFNLQMRVNFCDGGGGSESLRLVGTDGEIVLGWGGVKVIRNKMAEVPGYGGWDSFETFTKAQQEDYVKWYKDKYPDPKPEMLEPEVEYKSPRGYDTNNAHHMAFYNGIRLGTPIVEDSVFGMRAGGPALATNVSLFEKRIINWDAENMKVV